MKKQFIVLENDKDKRREFYYYIHDNYEFIDSSDKEGMIEDNIFPFVVDFNNNRLWVCNSITCCACAKENGQLISIKEFKEKVKERK